MRDDNPVVPYAPHSFQPGWIMLGTPAPDGGVIVWASDDLTQAELNTRAEFEQAVMGDGPFDGQVELDRRFTLTTTAYSIVYAYGADYPEAIRNLMTHWTPRSPTPKPLPRTLGGST